MQTLRLVIELEINDKDVLQLGGHGVVEQLKLADARSMILNKGIDRVNVLSAFAGANKNG